MTPRRARPAGRRYGVDTDRWGFQPWAWSQDGVPTWSWRGAPAGLVTRRQMRAAGLAPGGAEPVAQVVCRNGQRRAWLYDRGELVVKRSATPAQWWAVATAVAARQWCPAGGHYADYVVPTSLGGCVECHDDPTGRATNTAAGAADRAAPELERARVAMAWLRRRAEDEYTAARPGSAVEQDGMATAAGADGNVGARERSNIELAEVS